MTQKATLRLGRINANEEEAKVITLPFRDGQVFCKDDLLLTLETSKTAVDITAPSNGRMISVLATEGNVLRLGEVVFEADFEGEPLFEYLELVQQGHGATEYGQDARVGERKVSFKAETLGKSLGLDVSKIPATGNVLRESDVIGYFEKRGRPVLGPSLAHPAAAPQAAQCIILGAGGHSKSLIQMIRHAGYTIAGVTDTKLPKGGIFVNMYPVLGTNDDLEKIYNAGIRTAFIGVGGATNNSVRRTLFTTLKEIGFVLPPLVSRDASFDVSSHIGEATYVFPAASVGADCVIGVNCIINQGSITCHDCKVGDHAHLAPGAILAGACVIGESTTIGMGATVLNNVTVGRDCLIHNNVALSRDIPAGKIVTLSGILGFRRSRQVIL
jgi:sugar O-acyltransferase (sialic acid O-acetyltransferase NeuD family)